MKLSSLLGHTQELLALILQSSTPKPRDAGALGSTAFRGKPADALIDTFFRTRRYLGSHDRRFIAETTYGTLRHFRRSRYIAEAVLTKLGLHAGEDDALLLTGVAFLLHNGIETSLTPPDLAEKLHAGELKSQVDTLLHELTSYAIPRPPDDPSRLALMLSYPDWMVHRFIGQFGLETSERICASLNEQASLTLRVNTLKGSVEECQARLLSEGITTERTAHSPIGLVVQKRVNIFGLQAFRDGFFEVQDEGSQLLPLLVDPKPTAKVLDACAGAGGKSLAFASHMRNRGEIFATDINGYRLEELRKRARRAGVSNVRVKEVDSLDDLTGSFSAYFDVVFVDAPCSGLGTIRRNPGMKWSVTEETVREVAEKQRHILDACARLVKSGGRLVYATCTLLREENEDVVEAFLAGNPDFVLVDPTSALERIRLDSAVADNFIKLFPHIHGTDGFFCALMEKKPSERGD